MVSVSSYVPHPTDGPESGPATSSPGDAEKRAGKLTAAAAIRVAVEQFGALTGQTPEAVTGVRATPEGGWSVLVDVVELERVPATTTVMATYRVDLDGAGELYSCERLRRYTRGTTDL